MRLQSGALSVFTWETFGNLLERRLMMADASIKAKACSARIGMPRQNLPSLVALMVVALPLVGLDLAGQQAPIFEATVARVRVDIIVTDEAGRFVEDLRLEDFLVYEDGNQQAVQGAQLVDLAEAKVTNLTSDSGEQGSPEAVELAEAAAIRGAAVSGASASNLGAMIFLIDSPSLSQATKARFSDAWGEILDQVEALQVPRAAYMIDSVGRVEELVPLTFEVDSLREAAEAIRAAPTFGTSIHTNLIELAEDLGSDTRFDSGKAQALYMMAQGLEFEERARSLGTLEMLTRFCEALVSRPGRTALVWVSAGVKNTEGGPFTALVAEYIEAAELLAADPSDLSRDSGSVQWGYSSPDSMIRERQRELHHAANSANVSIYAVDPTPLAGSRSLGIDVRARTLASSQLLSSPTVQGSLDGLSDVLKDAATATGGKAAIHATDLRATLDEIERDSSRFYLLTYAPPPPRGDGEYHEIHVEVRRPGLTVRERGGYVDLPADERDRRAIAAALALPGIVTELRVQAEAYRKWNTQGQAVVQIAVNIDGEVTAGMIESDSQLELHLLVLDSNGEIVRETARAIQATPGLTSYGTVTATIPFTYFDEKWWALEPGAYELRLVVRDGLSRRLGATQIELEMPELVFRWRTSDVMLGIVGESRNPKPVVGHTVVYGQRVAGFLEVNGGHAPVMSGFLFRVDESSANHAEPDLERVAEMLPTRLRRDRDGVYRGALFLPDELSPGSYVIEVTVEDPPAREQRTYRVPLKVLPDSL